MRDSFRGLQLGSIHVAVQNGVIVQVERADNAWHGKTFRLHNGDPVSAAKSRTEMFCGQTVVRISAAVKTTFRSAGRVSWGRGIRGLRRVYDL
jgi:hypothetical protein